MSVAKVMQAIRLPGETLTSLKEQVSLLTDKDREDLTRWYNEEQIAK